MGFEPTLRYKRRPLFESGTINHSDTSPVFKFYLKISRQDNFADILLTNCLAPSGTGSIARYKLWLDIKPDGTKSYLGALSRTTTDAFQERHHKPLGHLSQLQLLYHFSRSCQNEAKISPDKE